MDSERNQKKPDSSKKDVNGKKNDTDNGLIADDDFGDDFDDDYRDDFEGSAKNMFEDSGHLDSAQKSSKADSKA